MQGDLAMLGGLRTAWRETVLSVKVSAKLALGIGAAATAITGMPVTAVVLRDRHHRTGRRCDALLVRPRASGELGPDIKVIELGNEMIEQTLGGLIAIIEGSFEIKDIGDRMRKESETPGGSGGADRPAAPGHRDGDGNRPPEPRLRDLPRRVAGGPENLRRSHHGVEDRPALKVSPGESAKSFGRMLNATGMASGLLASLSPR